ncbi:hypothetical protein, conserved [Eimeria tenella]|uniref:Uncharacterized protein n=1 Tax=Eimeria tenella TaxID=5802 RepID=U6KXG9_EIMTE|nr:hypothetical protein, conserved [Eimeria tenella]CDJ40190.1 hypothetical protein, conserved [Eimeria tenella]|eukprot:XP_013230943.1 hypothetical protein, conserved [Eimeria tenella]
MQQLLQLLQQQLLLQNRTYWRLQAFRSLGALVREKQKRRGVYSRGGGKGSSNTSCSSFSSTGGSSSRSSSRPLKAAKHKGGLAANQQRFGYDIIPEVEAANPPRSSTSRHSSSSNSSSHNGGSSTGGSSTFYGCSSSSKSPFSKRQRAFDTNGIAADSSSSEEVPGAAAAATRMALPAATKRPQQQQQQRQRRQQTDAEEHNEGHLLDSLPFLSPQQICLAVFRLTGPSSSSSSSKTGAPTASHAATLRKVAAYCSPFVDVWPHRDVAMLGVSLATHHKQQLQQQQQQQQLVLQQQQHQQDDPVTQFLQKVGLHVLQHAAQHDPRDLLRLLPLLAAVPPSPRAAAEAKAAAEAAANGTIAAVGSPASFPHLLAAVLLPLAAAPDTLGGPAAVAAAFAALSDRRWQLPEWAAISLAQQVRCCWQQPQQQEQQQKGLSPEQQQQQQHTRAWPTLPDAARTAYAFCRFAASKLQPSDCLQARDDVHSISDSSSSSNSSTRRDSKIFWVDWLHWFLGKLPAVILKAVPPHAAAASPLSSAAAVAAAALPPARAAASRGAAAALRDLSALASSLTRTSQLLPAAHAPVWRVLLPQLLLASSSSSSSSSSSCSNGSRIRRAGSAAAAAEPSSPLKEMALGCAAVARCSITAAEKQQLLQQFAPCLLRLLHQLLPAAGEPTQATATPCLEGAAAEAEGAAAEAARAAAAHLAPMAPVTAKVLLSSFATAASSSQDAAVEQLLLLLCRYLRGYREHFSIELLAYAAADAGLLSSVSPSTAVRSEAAAAVEAGCDYLLQRLQQQQQQRRQQQQEVEAKIPRQAAAALLAICSRLPTVPVRLVEALQQSILQPQQQQQQQLQQQQRKQADSTVSQVTACLLALSRFPRRLLSEQWTAAEQQLLHRLQQLQQLQQQPQQQHMQTELGLEEAARILSAYAAALREAPHLLLKSVQQLVTPQLQQQRQQQQQLLLQLQQQQTDISTLSLSGCMHMARLLETAVLLSLHLPSARQQQQQQQQRQEQDIQTTGAFIALLVDSLCDNIAFHKRCLSLLFPRMLSVSPNSSDDQQQQQQQQQQKAHQKHLQQLQRLQQQQRGLVGITAICATHLQHPPLLAEALQLRLLLLSEAAAAEAAAAKHAAAAEPKRASESMPFLAPSEELQVGRFVASFVAGCYCPIQLQQQQQQQQQQQDHQDQKQKAWDMLVSLLGGCEAAAAVAARAALHAAEALECRQQQQQVLQQQQQLWTSEQQHGSRPSLRMQLEVAAALRSKSVQHEVRSCLYTLDLLLPPLPLLPLC